jgi:hypothetical protein
MALAVRTQTLHMVCGSFRRDIKRIDSQEFLDAAGAGRRRLTLPVSELREVIAQVASPLRPTIPVRC